MNKELIFQKAAAYLSDHPLNRFDESFVAGHEELVGIKIFEDPIYKIGSATDPLFQEWKKPEVLHPDILLPEDWLPGAKTVISFFLPFDKTIVDANAKDLVGCVKEWFYARRQGQKVLEMTAEYIAGLLTAEGEKAIVPVTSEHFKSINRSVYTWSERHAGYICGLGTFGMSGGFISEKGMAGRLGSVITTAELPIDERPYSDWMEYCSGCGVCARNCPGNAIDSDGEKGKTRQFRLCLDNIMHMTYDGKPPYGCGKCAVRVPCQSRIPKKVPKAPRI